MEDDYKETINDLWKTIPKDTNLNNQLEQVSNQLSGWAKQRVGSLVKEIKKTKKCLNRWLEAEDSPDRQGESRRLEATLEKLLNQEETHWKQRSRNNWLKDGDRNMAYFHKVASKGR